MSHWYNYDLPEALKRHRTSPRTHQVKRLSFRWSVPRPHDPMDIVTGATILASEMRRGCGTQPVVERPVHHACTGPPRAWLRPSKACEEALADGLASKVVRRAPRRRRVCRRASAARTSGHRRVVVVDQWHRAATSLLVLRQLPISLGCSSSRSASGSDWILAWTDLTDMFEPVAQYAWFLTSARKNSASVPSHTRF